MVKQYTEEPSFWLSIGFDAIVNVITNSETRDPSSVFRVSRTFDSERDVGFFFQIGYDIQVVDEILFFYLKLFRKLLRLFFDSANSH
jgi:hypothetical protein